MDRRLLDLAGTTMIHRIFGLFTQSVALITDQGNNHAVEVEEEHKEVEAKLDEGFLNTNRVSHCAAGCNLETKLTFLCTFNLRKISVASKRCWFS